MTTTAPEIDATTLVEQIVEYLKQAAPTAGPCDLTTEQVAYLLGGVHPGRVQHLKNFSHLEAWDVRRTLTRIFGFGGWSVQTLELVCIREHEVKANGKSRWSIAYRGQVRLTVKTVDGRELTSFDDAAAGDAANQPSYGDAHDLAMKTALSQALKRCAVNLGDQLGLSLYRNGSTSPVVVRSAAHPTTEPTPVEDPGPGATEPPMDYQEWYTNALDRATTATLERLTELETEAAGRYRSGEMSDHDGRALRAEMDKRTRALNEGTVNAAA